MIPLLKNFTREKFPFFFGIAKSTYYLINKLLLGKSKSQVIFEKIYINNMWGNGDSFSGYGSNLLNTEEVRKILPALVKELNAESFLDIPCGDFFWMQYVDLPVKKYIGADIVKELVARNNQKFKNEKREFIFLDITRNDLPKVDIIFCRDCLPHLNFTLIKSAIKQIKKSCSTYLVTSTYISVVNNTDKPLGLFRPLNFQLPPFNFPQPLRLFNDRCIQNDLVLEDKSLGLWKIADLP